jgi:hypothetical protein
MVALQRPDDFAIRVIAPSGTPRTHTLRRGKGPGEVTDVQGIVCVAGDTLWVRSGSIDLHAYVTAPSFAYARTLRLPISASDADLTPQGALASERMFARGTPTLVPPTLIRFDGSTHPFGKAQPFTADSTMGVVTTRQAGGLWRAARYAYVIHAVDSVGNRPSVFVPLRDWFSAHNGSTGPAWVARPVPRVRAIAEIAPDRLAVWIARASPTWQPRDIALPPGPISAAAIRQIDTGGLFEHVVEVLDTRTGATVDSRIVYGTPIGFTTDGSLALLRERERGDELVLYRMRN